MELNWEVSLSQWGMFNVEPQIVTIPKGMKLTRADVDRLRQPGQMVIMHREDLMEAERDGL